MNSKSKSPLFPEAVVNFRHHPNVLSCFTHGSDQNQNSCRE